MLLSVVRVIISLSSPSLITGTGRYHVIFGWCWWTRVGDSGDNVGVGGGGMIRSASRVLVEVIVGW